MDRNQLSNQFSERAQHFGNCLHGVNQHGKDPGVQLAGHNRSGELSHCGVVTGIELAAEVRKALDESRKFLVRPPQVLLHDNKPIHDDFELPEDIEKTTILIPATPGQGEKKAEMEGDFGKFEQTAGTINLDDSSDDRLKKTALCEVLSVAQFR